MDDSPRPTPAPYVLDAQVGFLLRRANQRHLALFSQAIPDLTPTQFAALAKLHELGQASQNALGRATAMDAATIKGVVDRLRRRHLIESRPDATDTRRVELCLSDKGTALFGVLAELALQVSEQTLEPLSAPEREAFVDQLARLG